MSYQMASCLIPTNEYLVNNSALFPEFLIPEGEEAFMGLCLLLHVSANDLKR